MTNIPVTYLEKARIQKAEQLPHGNCLDCKSVLNIGIFFDGTGNNLYEDTKGGTWKHSNVARLYNAYRNKPTNGYFSHYMQGVGTPFKEIGELGKSSFGSAFSSGGEARIIWGLLQVLNSLHAFVNLKAMFKSEQMTVLASQKKISNQYPPSGEEKILDDLGLSSGLVGQNDLRRQFFSQNAGKLRVQLENRNTTPNISGVYLDVFGFSRGAAQARVFCNWLLDDLMPDGKLCGVPAYVRMLGLFETVASVGSGKTGHGDWASAHNLRIHPAIKTCVHYVALHELRHNFPLDSVCVHGELPPNCYEQIGPGTHSDMGGGYKAGVQGKGVRLETPDLQFPDHQQPIEDDSYNVSQLPLNLMLAVARRVRENHGDDGDPWIDFNSAEAQDRQLVRQTENGEVIPKTNAMRGQFDLATDIRKAVELYFEKCAIAPGPVDEMIRRHNTLYLAWRQHANFKELPSVSYANTVDDQKSRNDRKKGEEIFRNQTADVARKLSTKGETWTEMEFANISYHGKAGKIYTEILTMNVPISVGEFFDRYIRDSYAGFIGEFHGEVTDGDTKSSKPGIFHFIAERKRYLTYRSVYQGDDQRYNL